MEYGWEVGAFSKFCKNCAKIGVFRFKTIFGMDIVKKYPKLYKISLDVINVQKRPKHFKMVQNLTSSSLLTTFLQIHPQIFNLTLILSIWNGL